MIDLDRTDLSTLEAVLDTDKGRMRARFFPDVAPNHVRNFLTLAQQGFYDGTAFHRVVRGFMIQGGCPNTKSGGRGQPGTGGPGHRVAAEFNNKPHRRGVLSMARSAHPDSAGSQFFIVHGDHVASLDGNYTVFGELSEGLDVLDAIAASEVEFGAGGERSKPVTRIGLHSVRVEPAAAIAGETAETAE